MTLPALPLTCRSNDKGPWLDSLDELNQMVEGIYWHLRDESSGAVAI
jgi:hypothetical protein